MKLLRPVITIVCIVTTFFANAGEQLPAKTKGPAIPPRAAELELLRGTWEGTTVGGPAHEKITITFTGNSLHFHRDSNFWFETTFTLPAGTDPRQLHATIKDSAPPTNNSVGKVVFAIFKIEDGTLTLAEDDMSDEPPKTFSTNSSCYHLKKVQPQKKNH